MTHDLDKLRKLAGITSVTESNVAGDLHKIKKKLNESVEVDTNSIESIADHIETLDIEVSNEDRAQFEDILNRYLPHNSDDYLKDQVISLGLERAKEMLEELYTLHYEIEEWANSASGKLDDCGEIQDQPNGETIDNSLRRYLDAEPMNVKVNEDHTEEGMLKEYKEFKKNG